MSWQEPHNIWMASMHGGMDTATVEGGIYTPPQIKSLLKNISSDIIPTTFKCC